MTCNKKQARQRGKEGGGWVDGWVEGRENRQESYEAIKCVIRRRRSPMFESSAGVAAVEVPLSPVKRPIDASAPASAASPFLDGG